MASFGLMECMAHPGFGPAFRVTTTFVTGQRRLAPNSETFFRKDFVCNLADQ